MFSASIERCALGIAQGEGESRGEGFSVENKLYSSSPREGSLGAATGWIEALLQGQLATTLAILAVAFVGFQMMSGRLSMKAALRMTLGCFILFGSSAIAQGLIESSRDSALPAPPSHIEHVPPLPFPDIPPEAGGNPFDPYSSSRP